MFCSLFSVFDPSCEVEGLVLSLKWLSLFMVFLFLGWQFFAVKSLVSVFVSLILGVVFNLIKSTFGLSYKSYVLISSSLFFLIMMMGWLGMVPYLFTPSSHLVFNLSLSFPLWLGGMMYMFLLSSDLFFSHLVPVGTPSPLIPFLVIIESVSAVIRPFSLAVRLMSNIMAGHMILTLLNSMISWVPFCVFMIPLESGLMVFELGVSVIQAYVFMSLLSLYFKENEMSS